MMELVIQIKDGLPFEHPITLDNMQAIDKNFDINNLGSNFKKFVRVPIPNIDVYEVYEGCEYIFQGDICTEIHHVRSMTEEEKQNTQTPIKEWWQKNGHKSWSFDEAKCFFVPPVPMPVDDQTYDWNEEQQNWVKVTNV